MRRLWFEFVLVFAIVASSLAGSLPAAAQGAASAVDTAPSSHAIQTELSTPVPGDGAMVPITDPWVDPMATLDDAFFLSMEMDPLATDISGTTTLQPGEFQLLPAEVALTEFYAELYYETPVLPEGGEFAVGFCFWAAADGSCYDIGIQVDPNGNAFVTSGYAPAQGDYQMLTQTYVLADTGIDPTPGAENYLGLVVYEGYAILEGNGFDVLAAIALPDAALAGKVKAQIGFVDRGLPVNTPPLSVTITDLEVWDISSGMTPSFGDVVSGTPTEDADPFSQGSVGAPIATATVPA